MTIICQSCNTRLQIDDQKAPAGPFSVRCPKCKNTVHSSTPNPALDQSALGVGGSPSTEHPRYDQTTAPVFEMTDAQPEPEQPAEEAIRTLLSLLTKDASQGTASAGVRKSWNRRKALVCTPEQFRERIARSLSQNGYKVYLAEDTRQAIETMRANQLELVLLEPQFDVGEQGSAFVMREVNILRPAQRRRLFFVLISPSLRTLDAHAAFLSNVNAVVNANDLGDLPRILEVAFREYNELYRELNHALNLSGL